MAYFRIIDVPPGSEENVEQLGTKPKFWFGHNELGRCLAKITRPGTGEDWSEKVASVVAELLGLPHAAYELGAYGGEACVVSPYFLSTGCTLLHGNELLGRADSSYRRLNVKRYRAVAHTLDAVWDALHQTACELPLAWTPPAGIRTAQDVFTGYLLLDSIIGNTDRHHENWGVIEEPEEATARRHLAPTYDHASCLGCHLTDYARAERLRTADRGFTPEAYAAKARSAFYLDVKSPKPMLTTEAFRWASIRAPRASEVWLARLRSIPEGALDEVFDAIHPERISKTSAVFARRVLLHNVASALTYSK